MLGKHLMTPKHLQEHRNPFVTLALVAALVIVAVLLVRLVMTSGFGTTSTTETALDMSAPQPGGYPITEFQDESIIVDGILYQSTAFGITAEIWQPGQMEYEGNSVIVDGIIYTLTPFGITAEVWYPGYAQFY